MADGLEACRRQQRALAGLAVLGERRQLDAHERVLARRADAGAREVPAEQRGPEPAAPHVGMDRAPVSGSSGRSSRTTRSTPAAPTTRPSISAKTHVVDRIGAVARRPSRPGGSGRSAARDPVLRLAVIVSSASRSKSDASVKWRTGSPGIAGASSSVTLRICRSPSSVPPPYLRFMCSLDGLVDDLPGAAVLGAGRGSPSRAARASSRSSFRWLASRSRSSVPSSSAARTAQPGSPLWRQSLNRQSRRCRRRRRRRSRRPLRRRAPRAPGCPACPPGAPRRAARTARDGSSCAGRASRDSRTSAVAWRSSPSRALTRVDLPTPDEPRIAAVVPGSRCARSSSSPCAGPRRDRDGRRRPARSRRPRRGGRRRRRPGRPC